MTPTALGDYLAKSLNISQKDMGEIQPFRAARVVKGKKIYITFSVWNTTANKLELRKFYRIEGSNRKERIADATAKAREITRLLRNGYSLGENFEEEKLNPLTIFAAIREAADIKISLTGKQNARAIRGIRDRFLEWITATKIEKKPLSKLSKKHIYGFLDEIKRVRQLSNRTRNNYKDFLSQIFEIMVEREWIEKNPCAGITSLRTVSSKHLAYTQAQQKTLEDYLIQKNYPLYVFTRLIYHGFIRPVEITRLRLSDVFLDRGIILVSVETVKNAKQMPVVITQGLRPDLENFLHKYGSGLPENYYLFSKGFRPGPDYLHRNRFSEAHRVVLEATGLYNGKVDGYSWKHTGVTNAYLAGVDIVSIQRQCRHHSLAETEKYLRSLGLRFARDLSGASW